MSAYLCPGAVENLLGGSARTLHGLNEAISPCLMELCPFLMLLMQLRPLQMELDSFANGAILSAAWLDVSTQAFNRAYIPYPRGINILLPVLFVFIGLFAKTTIASCLMQLVYMGLMLLMQLHGANTAPPLLDVVAAPHLRD